MAKQEGNSSNARRKSRPLRYFYWNGNLHRHLHINVGSDIITAWCYPLHKRVTLVYSDVKRNHQPAFTTAQVCNMLNRSRVRIELAVLEGNVTAPQFTYGLNEAKKKYKYMWSEENVLEAHAFFSTVHFGRPRKDGLVTPQHLPTIKELRAMMRNEETLYAKGADGEFRPVWRANKI